VLGQACVERGDPRFLFLDDGEQLDDHLAHDERGLFPTGGVQRKPFWQCDRSGHRASSCDAVGGLICNQARSE
jgi:hypothetical protein